MSQRIIVTSDKDIITIYQATTLRNLQVMAKILEKNLRSIARKVYY